MLPPLTMDDFKDRFIDPNWSPFEMLLEIAEVEEQKSLQGQTSSHKKIHVGEAITAKPNKEKKAVAVASEANNTGKNRPSNASNKNIYDHGGITVEADSKNSKPNPIAKISEEQVCGERFQYLQQKPNDETLRKPNPDDNNGKNPLVLKLKRKIVYDDDNEHWVFNSMKAKNESLPSASNSNPRMNRQSQLPNPPLSKEFMMKKINELGGTDVTFLIQKSLFESDLSQQQNRLSMPIKQMKSDEFLRESELRLVESRDKDHVLNVPLLQPSSLEVWAGGITLKRWDMRSTSMYVLIGSWFRMAMSNGLKEEDIIQVWSFRVRGQLWMALIKRN